MIKAAFLQNLADDQGWNSCLESVLNKPFMTGLVEYLNTRRQLGVQIYPSIDNYFTAFNLTPYQRVKVVILGQDPYHGEAQAHGLCFSVPNSLKIPPSLKNIFKELESDLHIKPAASGCLEQWAKQGVFLLNSVLTVEAGKPASHQGRGWELFTDEVISILNNHQNGLVFLLWGSYAQKKAQFVDRKRHLVLEAAHPSPLSAYRGFLGCKHFSQTNQYLKTQGLSPINWCLE